MTNYRIIYAKPMVEFLAVNGIYPLKIIPKYDDLRFISWVFEDTVELQQTMRKYTKR